MAQFLLPCPCGQKVRVSNAQAGGQVACACGQSLSVPTLRGLRKLEPAPVEKSRTPALRWSATHGAIFSSAALIGAVGIALLSYQLFYYSQLVGWLGSSRFDYTVDRSKEVLEHAGEHIDAEVNKFTPAEALDDLRAAETAGLGEREPPLWEAAKKKAGERLWWIRLGGGLALGGLLVAALSLFVGRR